MACGTSNVYYELIRFQHVAIRLFHEEHYTDLLIDSVDAAELIIQGLQGFCGLSELLLASQNAYTVKFGIQGPGVLRPWGMVARIYDPFDYFLTLSVLSDLSYYPA